MGKLQHGEGGDTTETVSVAQEEVFQISKSQINKAKKKAKKKRLRDNELRERKKVWSLYVVQIFFVLMRTYWYNFEY